MMITGRVRSKADPRTLTISQLPGLPRPPLHSPVTEVGGWPTLGNDLAPCCTCAAAAHMIHHWTAAHNAPVLLSEDEVLATFVQVSGGSVDGAEMLEVLRFWRRTGIGNRRLRAYVKLDPHSEHDLRTTIYVFGAAYIGLSFPDYAVKEATSAKEWTMRPGGATGRNAPKEANGHCVAVVGYDRERLFVVSCGMLKTMTWEFYRAYNDEAYAVLSRDWYGEERKSPSGFDLDQLQGEIALLQEQAHRAQPPAV